MTEGTGSGAITAATALREHFDTPNEMAVACIRDHLDEYHRLFIRRSPFFCIASADADGQPTVSPRGDAPGFVHVLDAKTLLFPDRPGNNKVESFANIVANPKVGLIFFIPGIRETLRVGGSAAITRDPALLQLGQVGGKAPRTATVITVNKACFHCGKALVRSKLWEPESRAGKDELPTFGEIIKAQVGLDMSVADAGAILEDAYRTRLY